MIKLNKKVKAKRRKVGESERFPVGNIMQQILVLGMLDILYLQRMPERRLPPYYRTLFRVSESNPSSKFILFLSQYFCFSFW